MRKILTFILVVVLAVLLVSCGKQTETPQENVPAPEAEEVESEPVEAEPEPAEAESAVRDDGLPVYTGGPAELRMGWWGNDDRAE